MLCTNVNLFQILKWKMFIWVSNDLDLVTLLFCSTFWSISSLQFVNNVTGPCFSNAWIQYSRHYTLSIWSSMAGVALCQIIYGKCTIYTKSPAKSFPHLIHESPARTLGGLPGPSLCLKEWLECMNVTDYHGHGRSHK